MSSFTTRIGRYFLNLKRIDLIQDYKHASNIKTCTGNYKSTRVVVNSPTTHHVMHRMFVTGQNKMISKQPGQEIYDLTELVNEKARECIQEVLEDEEGCFVFRKKLQQPDFKLDWSDVEVFTEEPCFVEIKNQEATCTVFSTTYTNQSNNDQCHNVRFERQLSLVCESYLTKGFTTGFEVEIPFPATGPIGLWPRFSLQSGRINVDEKSTWVVQDSIKVTPGSSVVVSIKSKQKQKEFKFTTEIGLKGKVKGTFLSPNTQSKREFTISMRTLVIEHPEWITKEENCISYITISGRCYFKYNKQHEVIIKLK